MLHSTIEYGLDGLRRVRVGRSGLAHSYADALVCSEVQSNGKCAARVQYMACVNSLCVCVCVDLCAIHDGHDCSGDSVRFLTGETV